MKHRSRSARSQILTHGCGATWRVFAPQDDQPRTCCRWNFLPSHSLFRQPSAWTGPSTSTSSHPTGTATERPSTSTWTYATMTTSEGGASAGDARQRGRGAMSEKRLRGFYWLSRRVWRQMAGVAGEGGAGAAPRERDSALGLGFVVTCAYTM